MSVFRITRSAARRGRDYSADVATRPVSAAPATQKVREASRCGKCVGGGFLRLSRKALNDVLLCVGALAMLCAGTAFAASSLLNVSYDPTRELYQDFNAAFAALLAGEDRREGQRSSNPTAARATRRAR